MHELRWGSGSHHGRVRSVNQDALLAGPRIFAVADGMGGHAAGEVASSLVVAALADVGHDDDLRVTRVLEAVDEGNQRIVDTSRRRPETVGMGTTLAGIARCLADDGDRLLVFHVGDARVYRYRDGRLERRTVDHSVTQQLLDEHAITPEQALMHPERHAVTRALGTAGDGGVDWSLEELRHDDRYVICSDGLTDELDDAAIASRLATHAQAPAAVSALIDAALDAGGHDNVSVIVVDVRERGQRHPDAPGSGVDGRTRPRPGPSGVPT